LRDFVTTRLLLAARFFVAAFLVARGGEVLRAFLALFFLEVFLAFATTNFL
jgi:hypothetical protein